jgi:holin-like protein
MPILRGLSELIAFQLIGSVLSATIMTAVPGPILGLLLLLIMFCFRGEISPALDIAGSGLLRCMPLLLVPAAVGVMAWATVIEPLLWKLALILIASLFPAMIVCGVLMQFLVNRKEGQQ